MSDVSSETNSRFGTRQYSLLRKYQAKYPYDHYVTANYNLDFDRR
jgi:hypothetical protein